MKKSIKPNKAVDLVRTFFTKKGFATTTGNHVNSNGADLVILKGSNAFRIEVKSAFYSSRAWQVGKSGTKDNDFIAIVFPSGDIQIEDWESHISKCQKNGKRSLTKIATLFV